MNKIIILLTVAIACLFAVNVAAQTNKRLRPENILRTDAGYAASILYAQGVQAQMRGDYKEAANYYFKVISLNNEHGSAAYQLSRIYQSDNASLSIDYARRAYNSDSTNKDYIKQYIGALLSNNEFTKAKSLLTSLRQRSYGRRESYFFSVLIASQMQDDTNVISLGNEYIKNWGYDPTVIKGITEAMIRRKQYFELDGMLEKMVLENPSEQQIRISLGKVKATLMDDSAAVANFTAALAIDSMGYQGHLALADYYRIKGETAKYLHSLEQLFRARDLDSQIKAHFFEETFFDIQLLKSYYSQISLIANIMLLSAPNDKEIERVMLRFLMFTGDLVPALSMLNNKIELGTADESTYKNIIDIKLYQNKYDSVYTLAAQAEKLYPKSVDFPLSVAVAKWQQEKAEQALEVLKKCRKIAKNDSMLSVIYAFEGDIQYKEGRSKQAFAAYDKALRYDKNNAVMLNNYAYYLSLEKIRLEDALAMSARANELVENNPTYLDTQAWILYELGQYRQARTIQQKAVAMSREQSPELFMHYGDILFKLGEKYLAESYWQKALDAGADKEAVNERLKQIK